MYRYLQYSLYLVYTPARPIRTAIVRPLPALPLHFAEKGLGYLNQPLSILQFQRPDSFKDPEDRTMLTRSSHIARTLRLPGGMAARMYSDSSNTGPLGSGTSEDSFVKRERATEDYFVRQHEKEQLQRLRKQLKEHEDKVDSIKSKIQSLSKH